MLESKRGLTARDIAKNLLLFKCLGVTIRRRSRSFQRTDRLSVERGVHNPASLRCQRLGSYRMRRNSGMTLIELMMVVAIVALLVAIALPSYQRYLARGIRSQGQQFLMDLAQAQEQFFLDQRTYATDLGVGPGLLNRAIPPEVTAQYTLTRPFNVNPAANPPTFMLVLVPNVGGTMANSPAPPGDGSLIITSTQQRWREVNGNFIYDAHSGTSGDCTWEATNCIPGP